MIISNLMGIFVVFVVIFIVFGVFKKAMEVISYIAKLVIGGCVAVIVIDGLSMDFSSSWTRMGAIVIGAFIVFLLFILLAGSFRLVGYSINYFINCMLMGIIISLVAEYFSLSFLSCAVMFFLFPRFMWVSDRNATVSEYSHTSNFMGIETDHYNEVDVDWWEDLGNSWRWLPLQIAVASFFYLMGSSIIFSVCPIETRWLASLYLGLITVANVVFDLFVFREAEQENEETEG